MRTFWTSFNKNKKIILFLSIIFIIGLISGFIYFNVVKESIVINLKEELFNLTFNSSNMIFHCIVLSIIVIFSFLLVGTVFGLFVYFYEAMSIGFVVGAFLTYYGFSGFVYAILYSLVFKGLYIICFTVILIKTFSFSKNIIGYFVTKRDETLKRSAIVNFITIIKFLIIAVLNDVFLLLIGYKVLLIFDFLIGK